MAKKSIDNSVENVQLKEKIKQLEQALINSELRATAMETMIEVAEKELKNPSGHRLSDSDPTTQNIEGCPPPSGYGVVPDNIRANQAK